MISQKKDKEPRKQYHPAYCCAAELDFGEAGNRLTYMREHMLNTKPNQIDLLIIRNDPNESINNDIGAIFRKYNIFEYKSPYDNLGRKAFYITNAYANLLVGYSKGPESLEEITVTFIRDGKPRALFQFFRDYGFTVTKYVSGIYHVQRAGEMPRQVVVIRELGKEHIWLRALGKNVSIAEARRLAEEAGKMNEENFSRALSVMDVVNENLRGKEGFDMGKLLDQYYEYQRQLHEKDKLLDEKDEKLKKKDEEIRLLQKKLKEVLNKTAIL